MGFIQPFDDRERLRKDRAAVALQFEALLHAVDAAKSRGWPLSVMILLLGIAVFVAAVPAALGVRVVVAGVTNVSQDQFDTVAALLGRGTARWNRLEFKRCVESILGISIQDFALPAR